MVRSALPALPLDEIDLLVIENVGNLVCPAEFRVGEDARMMVSSVTEGEDKPLKYPLMFRACELVLVNKIDLLPHLDFDLDRFLYNLDAVHPGVERMLVSARTGEGVDEWRDWLDRRSRPLAVEARRAVTQRRSRATSLDAGSAPSARARTRTFFEAEAERLARLCHRMAERFARGGRLVAFGRVAGGPLGRAPRGGRVRPPGDRRQAGAARDRRSPARAGRSPGRWRCSPSPTTSRSPSGAEDGGERGARRRRASAAA